MSRRGLRARPELASDSGWEPRRSARLQGGGARRPLLEEPDVSDSEFGESQEMEQDDTSLPPTDDAVAGGSTMVTRLCAVVLDRLTQDEENAGNELEEREEMSRKGGKQLVSRIPTFQSGLSKKRPSGGSHNTEVPLSKNDPPAELQEKTLVADVPKSKLPGVREPATNQQPQRFCLFPKSGLEPASPAARPGQATASPAEGTRDPELYPFLTLTPRPMLRSNPQVREVSPEPEDDLPLSNTMPPGDTVEEARPASRMSLPALGDGDMEGYQEYVIPTAKELSDSAQAVDISEEVPPWESESTKYDPVLDEDDGAEPEVKDPQPAPDPRPVQDAVAETSTTRSACESLGENKSGGQDVVHQEQVLRKRPAPAVVSRSDRSELPKATKPPPVSQRAPAVKPSSPSAKRSGGSSFALFCLLPMTLLLVGGLGQHVWHYGLPRSVAHLQAQLELHYLEGLGLTRELCSTDCRVSLVESLPVGLYPSDSPPLPSISDSWLHLLSRANSSLQIAGFYVTLRDSDTPGHPDPTDAQGREVFEKLTQLQARGVKLQLAVNAPQTSTQDTAVLAATGAEVREVSLDNLTGGILHTKLWVVDHKHLYLGSANMDWRSLSQVKEVGLSMEDCSCLAQDAARIFGVYWSVGAEKNASLPPYWPARLSALSSSQQPLRLRFNGVPAQVYLSSAPPQISARGRTDDLSAILSVISDARKFIHISVMDYLPFSEYSKPFQFWPAIDSALREAACARHVEVRLMVSCWPHSPPTMFVFLQSLLVLQRPPLGCDINVKVFSVPSTPEQKKIPYARVNHAKYMVTDQVAYIGTSNWSENYFTRTAGVGLVVNQTGSAVGPGQTTLQGELDQLFLRDWSSSFATALPDTTDACCPLLHH
ncbi:Phospholipase D3 [Merluccius polli]|uniref:Phospholipase D3 n=1 Tax=Merluccius polli TaxID=89951 RepID=A0AA47P3Z6_MERPO|nr:Phospholipase D3 [Merluccius polli]